MYAYNPRRKSYQQLEQSMVGADRWDILNSILEEMDVKKGEGPKQHWMLIGPRGIGKSHLMTLLYHKVKNSRKLRKKWVPLLFPEELRMVGGIYQFLRRALGEIVREFDEKESNVTAELKEEMARINQLPAAERADHFFFLISRFYEQTGKHVVLITENLQRLLGKKLPVIEQKKLRAFLQTSDAFLIIGSATTVFEALHDHSHPFYHFFHVRRLENLIFEDMKTLIFNILAQRQCNVVEDTVDISARLKALYSFTGGNPRMAVFLADILSTEVPDEMVELMDRVLDELTPYFESIIDGIPDCFHGVINALAAFEPAQSPGEIAGHLEIPQSTVRSYLKKLKEDGYVRLAFSKGKSNYYYLNEYLYRVWFQMRDSSHREENRWLMELLLMIYSREMIVEEKARLDGHIEMKPEAFFYKKLINQTAQFIDDHPDYCNVVEWCVHAALPDHEGLKKDLSEKQKLEEEAFHFLKNDQMEVGLVDDALKHCEDVIDHLPLFYPVYRMYGRLLEAKELPEKALAAYLKFIQFSPSTLDRALGSLNIHGKNIEPLLGKLEPQKYITRFLGEEEGEFSKVFLTILLILFKKYDLVTEYIQEIFNGSTAYEGERKQEFELLVFTIKLSTWSALVEENITDVLKLIEFYVKYLKSLKTAKEKGMEAGNFVIDLFVLQVRFNIKPQSTQKILKRMNEDKDIPFSDVLLKIWTCLGEPDSLEAQRYLTEKAIAEAVELIKKAARPKDE